MAIKFQFDQDKELQFVFFAGVDELIDFLKRALLKSSIL